MRWSSRRLIGSCARRLNRRVRKVFARRCVSRMLIQVSTTPNTPDAALCPAFSLSSDVLALSAPPPIQTNSPPRPNRNNSTAVKAITASMISI